MCSSRAFSTQGSGDLPRPTTVAVVTGYGPGYYGSWSTYYTVGYGAVMDPGYTTANDVVTLETNFTTLRRRRTRSSIRVRAIHGRIKPSRARRSIR
jgi:hypothetical protein